MALKEIRWEGVEWIGRFEDKEKCYTFLDTVMNLPTA